MKKICEENNRIVDIYRKSAKNYNFITKLYHLVGINIKKYRRMGVDALQLKEGDTVIELGCGTGLNFELIEDEIGPNGKIIGIDITEGMLEQAKERIRLNGWSNVEIICSDIAQFHFPQNVDAIVSSGVFGYIQKYDEVIQRAAQALAPSKRFVIFDGKKPSNWLSIFMPLFLSIISSFGVNKEYLSHQTEQSFKKYFKKTLMIELYGGFVYLLVGEN